MMESALDATSVTHEKTVGTAYAPGSFFDGEGEASMSRVKNGRYIEFTAPCGATGRTTVREAEKLVEAVKAL
jgi:hypothetical protein